MQHTALQAATTHQLILNLHFLARHPEELNLETPEKASGLQAHFRLSTDRQIRLNSPSYSLGHPDSATDSTEVCPHGAAHIGGWLAGTVFSTTALQWKQRAIAQAIQLAILAAMQQLEEYALR